MFYGVISYTHLESDAYNRFRRQYDPWYFLIPDHITYVFTVPAAIGEQKIIEHIETNIEDVKSFDIHIKGLTKTWDHFLLLKLNEGNEEVIRLHDRLYSGILSPYLRKDIPFTPHIGLGLFVKGRYDPYHPQRLELDRPRYQKALAEAEKLNFDFWRKIEKITLIMGDEDFKNIQNIREFKLGG